MVFLVDPTSLFRRRFDTFGDIFFLAVVRFLCTMKFMTEKERLRVDLIENELKCLQWKQSV